MPRNRLQTDVNADLHQLPLAVVSDVEDLAPLGAVPATIPLGDGGRVDNLRGAVLDGVDLALVDLRGKDLTGVKLAGALNLSSTNFDNFCKNCISEWAIIWIWLHSST